MNHPDPPESKLNIEKQRCVFMLYTSGASFRRTVRRLLNEPFSTHPDSVQIGKNTETQSPHSPYIQKYFTQDQTGGQHSNVASDKLLTSLKRKMEDQSAFTLCRKNRRIFATEQSYRSTICLISSSSP